MLALVGSGVAAPMVSPSWSDPAVQFRGAGWANGRPKQAGHPASRHCPMTEMTLPTTKLVPNHPPDRTYLKFPAQGMHMKCPRGATLTTSFMDEELYDKVADSIVTAFNTHDARADFLDCVVRFATHDFMDVVVKDNKLVGGGMDSCMDFDNPDNFGLYGCMDGDDKLRVAYSTVCSDVSFADFAVIAAEALMAATSTYPSETRDAFKKNFMWGRRCAAASLVPLCFPCLLSFVPLHSSLAARARTASTRRWSSSMYRPTRKMAVMVFQTSSSTGCSTDTTMTWTTFAPASAQAQSASLPLSPRATTAAWSTTT